MELLVVMAIFAVLGAMSFSAFGGLQNTVKMNEYALTLEQDIRSVQRSAMLLQRTSGEKWLYGLGIDFGSINTNHDGEYTVFKWCSPFYDYGDILTRSSLPAYNPGRTLGYPSGTERNGYISNITNPIAGSCSVGISSSLSVQGGYDKSTKTPVSNITITSISEQTPRFVIFESVSGRAFFYDTNGVLLNYTSEGVLQDNASAFVITITPESTSVSTRVIKIDNLSGKVSSYTL